METHTQKFDNEVLDEDGQYETKKIGSLDPSNRLAWLLNDNLVVTKGYDIQQKSKRSDVGMWRHTKPE